MSDELKDMELTELVPLTELEPLAPLEGAEAGAPATEASKPLEAVSDGLAPLEDVSADGGKPAEDKPAEDKPAEESKPSDEDKKGKAGKPSRAKKNKGIVNVDGDGKVIGEAFPISKSIKRDHQKTSVLYTAIAFLLHLFAIVPLVVIPIFLASKSYGLLPSYGFWHFIGLILLLVFALIYAIVAFAVTRRGSKSSILGQTVKIAITYVCLTTVFGLILTYIVPDVIANATSSTLYAEDLYYLGSEQVDENAALERQFIMYNVLNGNMNNYDKTTGMIAEHGDFSYATLEDHDTTTTGNIVLNYSVPEIKNSVNGYLDMCKTASSRVYKLQPIDDLLKQIEAQDPIKYELYNFVYNRYVLNDFDYALSMGATDIVKRRALALSVVDYIYQYADYEQLVKDSFLNPKLKQLFQTNYDNFNQDGYQSFDDPLLLYAQLPGRMTVPVVLRLILNKGWSYSQPEIGPAEGEDGKGKLYYTDENSFLYEHYEPETLKAYREANPDKTDEELFGYTDQLMASDGSMIDVKYGFNDDGWKVFANGVVKRPINWLVLDMLGDPMAITSVDLTNVSFDIAGLALDLKTILPLLGSVPGLYGAVGDLLQVDVGQLINTATNGAGLSIGIYIDDNGSLQLQIIPMNADYGMLGYMQATWVQSNNLLMAVINVLALRNWLLIFGGIGAILVIAAGVLRECGRRTRMRAAIARDRILRASAQPTGSVDEAIAAVKEQDRQQELAPKLEQARINVMRAQEDLDHIEDEEYLKEAKKRRKEEDKQRKEDAKIKAQYATKSGTSSAPPRKEEGDRPANGSASSGSRPANGTRPSGTRPANGRPANGRPANGRPSNGSRPANGRPSNGSRPPKPKA